MGNMAKTMLVLQWLEAINMERCDNWLKFFVSSTSFNSKVAILRLKKLAVGNFLEGDAPTQYVIFLIPDN